MSLRKFGTPEPVEPVREEREEAADQQGINVTATRRQDAPFDPDEVIEEGNE